MMTIDDMLSQVAKIKGVAPAEHSVKETKPTQPVKPTEEVKPTYKPEIKEQNTAAEINGVVQKPSLSLSLAKEIAYCIEKIAEAMQLSAVISVADNSGRLILLEAMDNSFIASLEAAKDKAYTAVALKMPTHKALEESRGGSLDGYTNGNGILMLAGGYPIKYGNSILGGIGVSGGTKEQDRALAKAGVTYFEKRITN